MLERKILNILLKKSNIYIYINIINNNNLYIL